MSPCLHQEKGVSGIILQAKPIPEALAQYGTFDMDEKLVKMYPGMKKIQLISISNCHFLITDMDESI